MNKKIIPYLIGGAIVLLLGLGFWAGFKTYPALKPCPTITTTTILVPDTSWYTISDSLNLVIANLQKEVSYWKMHRDTVKLPGDSIFIPADVDTAAILKDHFTMYKYGFEKVDSNIHIVDSVAITQNVPVWNKLSYRLLKPQTIINNTIDNSVLYNSYIQFGISVPVYRINSDLPLFNDITNISLDLNYTFPKGYAGLGWQPETNAIIAKGGINIIKIKRRK